MNLLELPSGMISLEFTPDEQAEVRERLKVIAPLSIVEHASHAEVKVGRESFVQMNDWDEPCLIAQTERGSAILRRVYAAGDAHTSIAAE